MLELLAVAAAGAGAGAANSIAGGGALITFPTMVALGLPPLSANVTNTVGIVPASVGGAIGYADLLREQGERFARLLVPLLLGAAAGSAALLLTSNAAFEAIVPVLIAASYSSCSRASPPTSPTPATSARPISSPGLPSAAPTRPTSAPPSASSSSPSSPSSSPTPSSTSTG